MKDSALLTVAEANQVMAWLSELPIKHMDTVGQVQQFLTQKFAEDSPAEQPAVTSRSQGVVKTRRGKRHRVLPASSGVNGAELQP